VIEELADHRTIEVWIGDERNVKRFPYLIENIERSSIMHKNISIPVSAATAEVFAI
jgi:hypothetical protein